MATVHLRRPKPPGLPHGKVRTAAQLMSNPDMLAHLSVFDTQQTDLVHWRVGLQRYFSSRSPEHVEHVFIGGHDKYRKATHYRLIAAVTGEGLLTAEGDDWARNRRAIQPIFAKRHLDALVPLMADRAASIVFAMRSDAAKKGRSCSPTITSAGIDNVAKASSRSFCVAICCVIAAHMA